MNGPLEHYDTVGLVTAGTMLLTMVMMFFINRQVARKLALATA